MKIKDVEVLDVTIGDRDIAGMLVDAQNRTVRQTLELAAEERLLALTKAKEEVKQGIQEAETETMIKRLDLRISEELKLRDVEGEKVKTGIETEKIRTLSELEKQDALKTLKKEEVARKEIGKALEHEYREKELKLKLDEILGAVKAYKEKAEAISPQLIAALQTLGDKLLTAEIADSMSPYAILGGKSIADVIQNLLKGTALGNLDLDSETIGKAKEILENLV
jgi:major vault protein